MTTHVELDNPKAAYLLGQMGTEHPEHAVLSAEGCWPAASEQQAWGTSLATSEAWCRTATTEQQTFAKRRMPAHST